MKILKVNPGVVAAIHVAGVRGDPCGVKLDTLTKSNPKQHNMQKTTQFQPKVINLSDKHFTKETPQGSPHTPATCIAATTPGLIFRILNSVFFK